MISQLFYCLILAGVYAKNLPSFGINEMNNTFFETFYFEQAAPDVSDTDYIIYPSNPGNPGNYGNELNMVNYFSNLFKYSPNNKSGSCKFVSIAQVLSYFDTFYNDSIIPESYEKHEDLNSNNVNEHSPGTLRDTDNPSYIESGMTPYVFANTTYNECFDSKLMVDYNNSTTWYYHDSNTNNASQFINSLSWADASFIIDGLYGQYHLETGITYFFNSDNPNASSFRFNADEIEALLPENSSEEEFDEIARLFSDNILSSVIDVIDDGFPVILSINQGYEQTNHNMLGAHSVVAYDYEIIDGEIVVYCNFGYGSAQTHLRYDDGPFKYAFAYVPVRYNSPSHIHSDNYVIDNLKYCGCSHHTHDLSFSYVNNQKHSITCPCGYRQYENHTDTILYSCCRGGISPGVW